MESEEQTDVNNGMARAMAGCAVQAAQRGLGLCHAA